MFMSTAMNRATANTPRLVFLSDRRSWTPVLFLGFFHGNPDSLGIQPCTREEEVVSQLHV